MLTPEAYHSYIDTDPPEPLPAMVIDADDRPGWIIEVQWWRGCFVEDDDVGKATISWRRRGEKEYRVTDGVVRDFGNRSEMEFEDIGGFTLTLVQPK